MNGTLLKLIALILMLADHIHQFIPDMPIFLTWLGRLSAPIFMFCMAWGIFYTHDRKKYLLNMYFWSIGMAAGEVLLSILFPTAEKTPILFNNIFATLLSVGIIISIIDLYRTEQSKRATKYLLFFIASHFVSALMVISLLMLPIPQEYNLNLLVNALFPNVLFCEGGFLWVGVGVGFYFFRNKKLHLSLFFIGVSLFYFVATVGTFFTYERIFLQAYQWMMIGALPFMLLYNGKKGKGLKWLFYIFYPAHIYILFILGATIFA